ncbi:ribonuclease R [Tetragenococcus halophilus subsp. flandriensis]|uniref:ribonuclease R n=1 Tax=Tetragenococcus halophilus TaxID=51669 RepID=UPI0023E9A9B9|nr:ribonuclease R [Tetragenococcus halophilus]GMA09178.1 ribonuclease R [Tetragenococcus halophilus subsp. flandriensis]
MKETIKTKVLHFMENSSKKSFSMEEIAENLGLGKSDDFKALVQTVATMEREQLVAFNKKGKIKLPPKQVLVEGTFRANERGFGFVTIDPEEDDVYIAKENTAYAMDGDLVAIDIIKPSDPADELGAEGRIVEVRQRKLTQIVGEFHLFSEDEIADTDLYGVISPKDKKLSAFKVFISATGVRPVEGNIVIAEITHYPEKGYEDSLEGIVKNIIGHKDEPGMDILTVLAAHDVPTEFPEEVIEQAEQVPDSIDPKDYPDRKDRQDQMIVTIDSEEAKDLDDAVSVKKLENGHFFLAVHIADVSYYVTENSPLDKEALKRGTSVYLTDRVVPMLPQRLSNGICSLNPQVPRLAMSCEMEIDEQGSVVSYDIFPSVIKTNERMSYTAVNEILEDENPETMAHYKELVPMFQAMKELHECLETMRDRRGALTFEDNEAQVLVDEKGHPLDIILRQRGVGERIIESFMLCANETIAKHYQQANLPFIYRIHEEPKEEKLQQFFDFAATLGILVKSKKGSISPKDLQNVVENAAERPESKVINTMLLRSMQQARYSEENVGHYGLAAEYYTHFTSPIRRYPDLLVHRLIRSYSEDKSEKNQGKWAEKIPEIAQHSSDMERRAVECERDVDSMKKAEFMQDHIDEEFEGVISSVVKFGFFVELPNTIEGLIHVSELENDYFQFVESQLALVGEHTNQTFKIGQQVKVRVTKADPDTREVDFELVDAQEVTPVQTNQQKNRKQRRKNKEDTTKPKKDKKSKKGKKNEKKPFYKDVPKGTKKKK